MTTSILPDTEIVLKDHIVQIYAADDTLIESLAEYVSAGFDNREGVVIVASPVHLLELNRELVIRGYDLDAAMNSDRYITIDAAALLENFMVNNWPAEDLFVKAIVPVLERAGAGNRKVRVFGEMVMLLWKRGFHGATIYLEHLWNELAKNHDFTLLCAYQDSAFNHGLQSALQHICKAHSQTMRLPAKDILRN